MKTNIGFYGRMSRLTIGGVILIVGFCSNIISEPYYYFVMPWALLLALSGVFGFSFVISVFSRKRI